MSDRKLFLKYAEVCDQRVKRLVDVQESALFMALRDMLKRGSELAEAENSRDQYKALVDRYCQRHDARSCACEFGDDGDEPISQCNYHLDLSKRLAEADQLLKEIREDAPHFGMPTVRIESYFGVTDSASVHQETKNA